MKKPEPKICPITHKVGFSEAQASRKLGKYDDIVRYYPCNECGAYHLTSENMATTLGRNILSQEDENTLLKAQNKELKETIKTLLRKKKL